MVDGDMTTEMEGMIVGPTYIVVSDGCRNTPVHWDVVDEALRINGSKSRKRRSSTRCRTTSIRPTLALPGHKR